MIPSLNQGGTAEIDLPSLTKNYLCQGRFFVYIRHSRNFLCNKKALSPIRTTDEEKMEGEHHVLSKARRNQTI